MGDGEVAELFKIANGYLPRVRLEYDKLNWEKNSLRNELNAWKFEIDNAARIYQGFCDRNFALKNRVDQLHLSISDLENKKAELEKTTTQRQHSAEIQENNAYNSNLNLEIEQEDVIFTNDIFIPPSNIASDYYPTEHEMHNYHSQIEPPSGKLIFDTRDLFRYQQE